MDPEMWRTARRNNPMMMQHQYSRMNPCLKFDTYIATTINLQLHSFISNILECSLNFTVSLFPSTCTASASCSCIAHVL